MQQLTTSGYNLLETLEIAYEALLRSIPDKELLVGETIQEAHDFHRSAMIAVGEKVREYRNNK